MTAPDHPMTLKSVKPDEWPERLYGGKAVVRFPNGVESGSWYSTPDARGEHTREYVRADLARPTPLAEALATIARLEGERDALRNWRSEAGAEYRARQAAEAKVAALVTAAKAVADDVCSYICPSIGLAGAEIPHDPACIALRAAISGCDHG